MYTIQFASWPLLVFSCVFCAQMQSVQLPVLPCPGKTKPGEDHPDTLSSLNNLAGLLKAQWHLEEAEPLYREALKKSPGAQFEGFQTSKGVTLVH